MNIIDNKFGAVHTINQYDEYKPEILDVVKDTAKQNMAKLIGNAILDHKPGVLSERVIPESGDLELRTEVYVFTHEELLQLKAKWTNDGIYKSIDTLGGKVDGKAYKFEDNDKF